MKESNGFQKRAFPVERDKRNIFKDLIKEMVEQDVIEDTDNSEYGSSCFLVRNKGGFYRIIGNCTKENELIVTDNYSTPKSGDCLTSFAGCTWFPKFD